MASDFSVGRFCGGKRGIPALVVSVLMYKNPFMIYAGQEFGERGMDKEGFSGLDGRTTIFDYWTVLSLYNGYVSRRCLSSDERNLERTYSKVLNIAITEKAVSNGLFFDLMYANNCRHGFNPDKHYAFLRKCDHEVLLVVANFSDIDTECEVLIPAHAFEYLGLPEKTVHAKDLLSDEKSLQMTLKADDSVKIVVNNNNCKVYKFIV